jgi:uncharacterized protein YceH (UPF0502 family)
MDWQLDAAEVRVLGALLEKEIATPEYYPLSLNALVNACNQKTNREPVVAYDESTVEDALEGLRHKSLATRLTGRDIRVPKHAQRFTEEFNLGRREAALLCLLLLRGPQTVGELRGRSDRLYQFDDLEAVETTLHHLAELGFVVRLTRYAGSREARWAHLLAGQPELTSKRASLHPLPRHIHRLRTASPRWNGKWPLCGWNSTSSASGSSDSEKPRRLSARQPQQAAPRSLLLKLKLAH